MDIMGRLRRVWARSTGRDRRWITDDRARDVHEGVVRDRLSAEAQDDEIIFDGGPRDGQTDTLDQAPVVIGTGEEGGVYQRTNQERNGLRMYRWHELTPHEAAALLNADLRQNQGPEQ
jgi:hypothetical protein